MQTMAAVVSAMARYCTPTQPMARKRMQVSSSVATVMPEMGFDEEPISPVMRDETTTKKKPKSMMRIAGTSWISSIGVSHMMSTRPIEP